MCCHLFREPERVQEQMQHAVGEWDLTEGALALEVCMCLVCPHQAFSQSCDIDAATELGNSSAMYRW